MIIYPLMFAILSIGDPGRPSTPSSDILPAFKVFFALDLLVVAVISRVQVYQQNTNAVSRQISFLQAGLTLQAFEALSLGIL